MVQIIRFKDLSTPLKIAIIFSYIVGSIYAIAFLTGVIMGITGL